ncbi:MAG: CBS domain-containing protein [Proteobacteria bacterium]|nr:CBS domain-containing protein [Pseudomonadota bacterium]
MTIGKMLKMKGSAAPRIRPSVKVKDVVAMLKFADTGAIIISDDGAHIDGIITERDIVRGLHREGAAVLEFEARRLMTENVITCRANDRVADVMEMMNQHRIRHVPVVADDKIAGIINLRDILGLRLEEAQHEADEIRYYIAHA